LTAFTIVELLVVIGIIAVLMSLLVPAVLRARSAARRTQCLHNMSQVGKALNLKAMSKGYYPGYRNPGFSARPGEVPQALSWVTTILPELDRIDLAVAIRAAEGRFGDDLHVELPILKCPSGGSSRGGPNWWAALSFAVNAGIPDAGYPTDKQQQATWIPDTRANGVFHRHVNVRYGSEVNSTWRAHAWVGTDYISSHDGTANTILLSENVDAIHWEDTREPWTTIVWKADGEFPINVEAGRREGRTLLDYSYSRPSSFHAGGVNVVYTDGHGQFLREDIEYWVYVQLMTPDGKKAMIDVNGSIPVPAEYKQLLSASDYE
jgi:prepilin-type processing-associated H-X9-DG protein